MTRYITILIIAALLTGCAQKRGKTEKSQESLNILSEPDKFLFPDTSVYGIILRDSISTVSVIGTNNTLHIDNKYHFYSKTMDETLSLTQHPGDEQYSISVFEVELSIKADFGFRHLNTDKFTSEKGIQLGFNKKQITDRLGTCYIAKDSMNDYIELYYRIESPKDSHTGFLVRNKIPIYYASYKLLNDKLEKFDFGIEYP